MVDKFTCVWLLSRIARGVKCIKVEEKSKKLMKKKSVKLRETTTSCWCDVDRIRKGGVDDDVLPLAYLCVSPQKILFDVRREYNSKPDLGLPSFPSSLLFQHVEFLSER